MLYDDAMTDRFCLWALHATPGKSLDDAVREFLRLWCEHPHATPRYLRLQCAVAVLRRLVDLERIETIRALERDHGVLREVLRECVDQPTLRWGMTEDLASAILSIVRAQQVSASL